jgi:hypothetical protein
MPDWKDIVATVIIVLVVMAIANRVPFTRTLVGT